MLYRNLYIYEAWKRNSNLNPEMYKNETGKHNNNKTLQKNMGGAGKTAQQWRTLVVIQRTWYDFQYPCRAAHDHLLTPVPEERMPSSSFHGH